jgi:hypothetical protein
VERKDYLRISLLVLVAVGIFYPLFYTEYAYTDEFVQLWLYKKGSNFQMFLTQGRYVTEKLFQWLFGNAKTIHDITTIRLFSFFGWLVCVPAWYFVIKKVTAKEKLPELLVFFSILYLICSPPFSIYVQWASCHEHFIANTSGLLSGYILYSSARYENNKPAIPFLALAASIILGVISLLTYQNGFGSFFLPFVIHLAAKPKNMRLILLAAGVCILTYIIYYFLFKSILKINHLEAVGRTNLSIDLFPKIRFFFGRALAIPFHFNYLFNEKDLVGAFAYLAILFTWIAFDLRISRLSLANYLKPFAITICILVFIYLPSLIVKENYASNRTLFALNLAVFFLVANTLLTAIKKYRVRLATIIVLSSVFVANAYYNFSRQFLKPVKNEYRSVRAFIEANYHHGIDTIYFIQPHEDFFVRKYKITRSWDEFGVPSTFFNWVPEFFVKQVIFEKTGNRQVAEQMITKQWADKKQFSDSSHLSPNAMIVDVEEIMK